MSDTDRKTVLVVDDVPENIKFTKAVLSDEYNIETAQNGEEAIENVMSDNPPDLILLDIIMPGTSGFEVLDELKSELTTREIPVIVVSAIDEMDSVEQCLERGAIDYLFKPFRPNMLRARVKACLITDKK